MTGVSLRMLSSCSMRIRPAKASGTTGSRALKASRPLSMRALAVVDGTALSCIPRALCFPPVDHPALMLIPV
ncbi:hypothetical protein DBR41_24605 [Pseudomonas sp. HMWF010]|nr:hypothetical protein DBR41_24605 [Pseudomonas sp. HMWF010]